MRGARNFQAHCCRPSWAYCGRKYGRTCERLPLILLCILTISLLIGGCSAFNEGSQAKKIFDEANDNSSQGNYKAALAGYEQIIEKHPSTGDRALFEMGIIYAHPKNMQKDYDKSLDCLQTLIKEYPASGYRHDGEMMMFNISNVLVKDKTIAMQQLKIDTLQQEVRSRENEISTLQKQIRKLGEKVFSFAIQTGPADKILVEKKARQLKVISRGEVIKTYKIALGGNPEGPKEQQGDNKTPEGTYFIEARNKDSRYHLALRISYPNARDKERARQLGVSPGGDIMIHGSKNGFSWVGDAHTEADWTQGCIAVTDEEIKEIDKIAPVGTIVEIRP